MQTDACTGYFFTKGRFNFIESIEGGTSILFRDRFTPGAEQTRGRAENLTIIRAGPRVGYYPVCPPWGLLS